MQEGRCSFYDEDEFTKNQEAVWEYEPPSDIRQRSIAGLCYVSLSRS